jgi:hypothetical protein
MIFRLLPCLTLLAACTTGPADLPAVDTEISLDTALPDLTQPCDIVPTETDDHFRTATRVLPGDRWTATSCGLDEDWYLLDLPALNEAELRVTPAPGSGAVALQALDAELEPVGTGVRLDNGAVTLRMSSTSAPPAYVVVRGDRSNPADVPIRYAARFDAVPIVPCAPDAWEPNDGTSQAASVLPSGSELLTSCPTDVVDWYAVQVVAGETLTAQARFSHAEGDLQLFLLDRPSPSSYDLLKRTAIASSTSNTDHEKISFKTTHDGPLYLVTWLDGASTTPPEGVAYRFELDVGVIP